MNTAQNGGFMTPQPGSAFAPLPPLPPPAGFMPGGYGSQVPRAQSFPMRPPMMPGPTSDIPPPHMVAPSVFYRPNTRPGAAGWPPQYNNQQYNNQQYNNQQWMTPPYPYQPPMQTPVQQPPQQQQQPPQEPPKPPEQKNEQPKQDQKPPTAKLGSGLDDATIKQLNERLNSDNDGTRADAAMEIYKILEKSPDLQDNPAYKPYIDAFMEKILADPSAVVRQAGMLTLEMGLVKAPSQKTQDLLGKISNKAELYNIESGVARGILANIQSGKFAGQAEQKPVGQKLDVTSNATDMAAPAGEEEPAVPAEAALPAAGQAEQPSQLQRKVQAPQAGIPQQNRPGPQATLPPQVPSPGPSRPMAMPQAAPVPQRPVMPTGFPQTVPNMQRPPMPAGVNTARPMGVNPQIQGQPPMQPVGSRLNIQEAH